MNIFHDGRYWPDKNTDNQNVHGFSRLLFPRGAVLEARIGLYGQLEVEAAGSRYVPLLPDQWELVLADEDLQRLLDDG